jgi:hypothetical protein
MVLAGPLSFRLYDAEQGLNKDEFMTSKLVFGLLLFINLVRQHLMKKASDSSH